MKIICEMTDLISGEGNASSAWGLPIRDVDTFKNLTDSQFLVRVLGPKHMGYGVSKAVILL